jgi:hypothetical protein
MSNRRLSSAAGEPLKADVGKPLIHFRAPVESLDPA